MQDILIVFASLLLILILISAFGGGIRVKEPFEDTNYMSYPFNGNDFQHAGTNPAQFHPTPPAELDASLTTLPPQNPEDNGTGTSDIKQLVLGGHQKETFIEPFSGCSFAGCMV